MTKKNEQKWERLLQTCTKALQYGEYNMRTIKGVRMSVSDVQTAILYAETALREGCYSASLMKPRCEVKDLLEAFGLLEEG